MAAQAYYVYVIRLSDEVLQKRSFRAKNPGYEAGKPCYYVGSSYHPPEVRFRQHLEGHKASRFPREYGRYLAPRKYRRYNPFPTRDEALRFEGELAERLRRKGHGVWQG